MAPEGKLREAQASIVNKPEGNPRKLASKPG